MPEKTTLTTRQAKAIPVLLAAPTYEKGCKSARIARTTLYKWMQEEEFAAEFDRQRSKIIEAAFGMIAQNIEKAVAAIRDVAGAGKSGSVQFDPRRDSCGV